MKKLISIVTAMYDEEENVKPLYDQICDVFSLLQVYDMELIYVNDGSHDSTRSEIEKLALKDRRVKLV
ncbi:MAG: glycosyltransferase, partial [Pseudomonadota bacterium]